MNRVFVAAAVVVGGVAAYLLATRASAAWVPEWAPDLGWSGGWSGDAPAGADPLPAWEPVQPTESYSEMMVSAGGASRGDQNIAAFLMAIRAAEGTAGARGYQTMFGYRYFDSFADHPRQSHQFQQTDGKTNTTTAAGAYQFLASTWDRLRAKLGLPDFSPASQDAAAVELIREKGALADVVAGRFDEAVSKLGGVWASLPSSRYPQGKRSVAFVRQAYEQAGGQYA